AFRVVAARGRQLLQASGFLAIYIDVHLRVVVPGVAAFLARGAKRVFVVLELFRLRIGVRRREFDLVGPRPEERAGRLADAGGDPPGLARRQVERIDLIEGIARLALTLKDQPAAIGGPVALAGALAFDRQAAHAREEVA